MRKEIMLMTAVVISAVSLAVAFAQNGPHQTTPPAEKVLPEPAPEPTITRTMPMLNVGRMLQSLQKQTDVFDYAMAVAYIRGVDAGMWATIPCYVGLTDQENEEIAMSWVWFALQNPDVWQKDMAVAGLTFGMLKTSFPCKTEEENGQGSGDPETPEATGGDGSDDQ